MNLRGNCRTLERKRRREGKFLSVENGRRNGIHVIEGEDSSSPNSCGSELAGLVLALLS